MNIHNTNTLTGHKGGIYSLEQSNEPHCFYSADGAGWIVKWNLKQPDTAQLIAKVPSNIFALRLLKDQNLLAVGSLQGILYLIDLHKNEVLPPPIQLSKTIYSLQYWNRNLLIGTGDGFLHCLHLPSCKLVKTIPISSKSIRQISIPPQQNQAVIASSDHHIYHLDLSSMKIISQLQYHSNSVFCLQWLQNGSQLVAGSRDARLSIWAQTGNTYSLQHTIPAHLFTINDLQLSPDQQWLASASRDKSIKIWNTQTWQLEKVIDSFKPQLNAHRHSVNTLLWLPTQNQLISGSDDKTIRVWRIDK